MYERTNEEHQAWEDLLTLVEESARAQWDRGYEPWPPAAADEDYLFVAFADGW